MDFISSVYTSKMYILVWQNKLVKLLNTEAVVNKIMALWSFILAKKLKQNSLGQRLFKSCRHCSGMKNFSSFVEGSEDMFLPQTELHSMIAKRFFIITVFLYRS